MPRSASRSPSTWVRRRRRVYDLEVNPNRPDLNSVIGIAREIAAVTGHPLRMPDVILPSLLPPPSSIIRADDLVAVRIEDADLCPRYVARVVRGVKVGPSPDWLRQTLEKVGLRSINNVVDVTNYVMMETGQPLHAFDYHLVAAGGGDATAAGSNPPPAHAGSPKPTLVIRRSQEGELFISLDGQKRTLTGQMLLVADETKAIALAGVMGGQTPKSRTGQWMS